MPIISKKLLAMLLPAAISPPQPYYEATYECSEISRPLQVLAPSDAASPHLLRAEVSEVRIAIPPSGRPEPRPHDYAVQPAEFFSSLELVKYSPGDPSRAWRLSSATIERNCGPLKVVFRAGWKNANPNGAMGADNYLQVSVHLGNQTLVPVTTLGTCEFRDLHLAESNTTGSCPADWATRIDVGAVTGESGIPSVTIGRTYADFRLVPPTGPASTTDAPTNPLRSTAAGERPPDSAQPPLTHAQGVLDERIDRVEHTDLAMAQGSDRFAPVGAVALGCTSREPRRW